MRKHSGMVFVITCQTTSFSADVAQAGTFRCLKHTLIRSDTEFFVSRYKTAESWFISQTAANKNRPRQASHFCIVDFEKAVCFLRVLLFIWKASGGKWAGGRLNFYLVEKEQFPKIRKLLKLWMWAAKPCGSQRKRSWLEESRSFRIEDIGRAIQAAGIYLRFSKRYPS